MRQKNLKRVSKRLLSFVLSLAMIFTLMISTSIPVYAKGITVKVVNDNTEYTLDVEPSDTIENIKNQLVEKTEISTEQQILKYNNIELENNRFLEDYNIQQGAVLELELKTLIQVPGSGTEENPYIISNTQEFKDVLGKSKDGTYYKLSDNFDNTEEITTPISNFHGSLDGNGKTINVNIDNSKGTNYSVGLFSVNDGQISNLNVAGKIVGGRSTATGGICAYNYSGVISNCNNYAEVIGTDTVGGICGCDWYDDGKFLQCNNYGNISGNEQVGGICGSSKSSVKECENRGSVTATKHYAGGIVGQNLTSMEDERVEKCKNYGNVTCESYKEYIGYDNSQMAYKKDEDGSYSVIGKVGNAWQQIHYRDWAIETETNNKNLSVSLTPEIVSDGKLLKFTVSITNSTSDTISEAKAVVCGDTELGGCDRSTNRTNTDNSIMTMSYNDVTFLAFSNDIGFRIVNTDFDNHNEVDAPQINEICDSAYSAQWNIDSIAGNETVTRTFYMECLEGEDFSDADLNKIVNSAFHTHDWKYSVNGNKIESYCTAEGCTSGTSEMNKCSLILSAYDSVYSGKAYDGLSWTNNITDVTGAKVTAVEYVGRDGTDYGKSSKAPVNAGKYTALVTIGGVTASADFEITKGQAEKPSADTTKFVYNGSDQTYQIADSELYTVSGNVQKDAGTYTVTVSLKDKNKTEWSDGTTDDLTFTFTIAKSDTKLIAEPAARELTYAGHPQNLINAASATGGTVYYRLDGTEEWSETVPTAANAGTYKVFYYVKANDAKNYNDTGSEADPSGYVEIKVAKRELTADMVTVSDDQKYTGEAISPTVTVSDKVNDVDIISSADYTVSGNEAQTKVGAYDITVSASENGNYTGSVTKTWNIVTSHFAEDSIQANGYEGVYDGKGHTISVTAPKGATITYSETENGEYTEKAPSYKDVTETTVYYHVEKYGYETAKGSAVVKITPKTIGLTWGDHEFTYNGKVQAPKASATDLIDGDSCDITVSEGSVNYTEKPLYVTATGVSNPNYQLPTAGLEQEYTIAKKTIGIKWSNTELTYIGEEQAPTATATGLVDGDTCEIEVSGAAADYGTHTVKAVGISNANYQLPENATTTFTIDKAVAEVQAPEAITGLIYNGENQTLIAEGNTADGTLKYKVNGGDWTEELPAGLDAGTYEISYKVFGDENHKDSKESTVTVTIAKKAVTVSGITAEDKTYDGNAEAVLNYTGTAFDGLLEKDSLSVTAKGAFTDKNAGAEKKVQISGLTLSGASIGNYELASEGQQTETTAQITAKDITAAITPNGGTYEGTITPATAVLNDLVKGDDPEITLTYTGTANDGTVVNGAKAPTHAGTYTVTASITDSNYNLLKDGASAEYVVAKAAPALSVSAIADKNYGDEAFKLEVSHKGDGVKSYASSNEKVAKVDKDGKVTIVGAGKATLTVSLAESANYTADQKEVTVTVKKVNHELVVKNLTYNVTYGDSAFKIAAEAGDNETAIKFTSKNKDVASVSEDGTVTVGNAGTAKITVSMDESDDYMAVAKEVTVNVAPKAVTVTANDAEKHVNKADPELDDTINGVVGMERLNGVSIMREAGEAVGTYAINVTVDADANPNYDITTVSGTFTINDHDWSGEWKTVKEATETENGKCEKSCGYDGCEQKLYETIPATGTSEEPENPGEGTLRKDAEVALDAPISEATLDNTKSELIKADGIFTEAEKEAISNGSNARVWLEITGVDMSTISKDDQAAMEEAAKEIMGENLNLTYFNADLFKQVDGTAKTQIHEPGAMIKVTIQIPEELLNHDKSMAREYKILRLHDGKVDVISGTFNADTNEFTFETDKFSTYAIAYGDTQLVTGVSLDTTEKTLTNAGETLQLTATVTPENAANKNLHWISSDPKVATVDENGLVTAVSNGTAVITVTTEDGNYTAACKITVNIPAKPTDTKPADNNTTSKPDVKKDTTSAKAPKTDDPMNAAPWAVVALIAGCVAVITGKKRKQERR